VREPRCGDRRQSRPQAGLAHPRVEVGGAGEPVGVPGAALGDGGDEVEHRVVGDEVEHGITTLTGDALPVNGGRHLLNR
jgi:hypothetical protein